MFITAFPAGPLAANCYVVAAAAESGAPCVVVDPGQDAAEGVAEAVARHGLAVQAVLLTHGHFDHVWSAASVAAAHGCATYVHAADRVLLTDPAKGLDPVLGGQLAALLGDTPPAEPDPLVELAGGERLALAGLEFSVAHVPGHTPGSVAFGVAEAHDGAGVLFTGDLLFAGSIGRTDLPGGDHAQILASLDRVCAAWGEDTHVLPGHGPRTTLGRERATNPFLRDIAGR
ncbi:MBL fold metallo-hydrolase [Streptomonospora nanhaiensis]|uniref:Glyoxylase-like metal-dependent hydrolase (Beta-lactamase superfamily II) n=1 Tax=Streptomonospora nanhaiensis TaxID=1323731 RepID=A0A853BU40_9ACTN|nr:MBL fold metallo-hydrolase [Streptomonospora nanhaiensis]MBV2364874.1 MBL fold metallo-hydrolase [Streptomonospora nanhaiensis]MBX9387159.1 MBL fold metallo-hydrolase [Streptomonospora nanhaiensis]NYI98818.1 glyoxylase-like metal-dependent hydrolase (beta-lactamase superfamily II) [Streptomonospora nanhaiensis]